MIKKQSFEHYLKKETLIEIGLKDKFKPQRFVSKCVEYYLIQEIKY